MRSGLRALARPGNGGVPARRAVIRWAWRLLRREWRQQLLILALITVAVAATVRRLGGGHQHAAPGRRRLRHRDRHGHVPCRSPHVTAEIAALAHRFGRVDVIENETLSVPGSVTTYSLRAQNPNGAFGQPMLSLASGRYPSGTGPGRPDQRGRV